MGKKIAKRTRVCLSRAFRQRTLCSYHVMLLFKKTFTVLVLELTFEIFLRIIIIVYGSDISI
jgi:hypothetical protein